MTSLPDEPRSRTLRRPRERHTRIDAHTSPVRNGGARNVAFVTGALFTITGAAVAAAAVPVDTPGPTSSLDPVDLVPESRDAGARSQMPRAAAVAEDGERRLLRYPYEQVWPTAIRFLRLDRGYTIVEQDKDAGYVIFEFALEGTRTGRGQLEFLATTDAAGRPSVEAVVRTSAGPAYLPFTLLDELASKIQTERGQPAPPPPPASPSPEKPPKAK